MSKSFHFLANNDGEIVGKEREKGLVGVLREGTGGGTEELIRG